MSINSVVITGRLTADIDLKSTAKGTNVTTFTIAVDNPSSAGGQKSASFIQCTAWDKIANFLNTYSKKGTLVGVEGRLQQRSYEGKNGKTSVTEVVVTHAETLSKIESKQENSNNMKTESNENASSDDDLPF